MGGNNGAEISRWQLPGPGRFLSSAVEDLRSGRNVIFRFPLHAGQGIQDAIRSRICANDLWRWRTVDACRLPSNSLGELAAALHDSLGYAPPTGQLPGPAAFAEAISAGDMVWIENLDALRWPVWKRFLYQYQHACHARDENQRGLFCSILFGALSLEPEPDIALAVHRWEKSVTQLDVTILLDRLMPLEFPCPTLRKVALSVATELSGADLQLATSLAAVGKELLVDHLTVLKGYAQSRDWSPQNAKKPEWHSGAVHHFEGETRIHSAALSLTGDTTAITRRVWRGQVSVLYPFIEEQRVRLVPDIEGLIQFPVETTYGKVTEASHLEIGQLVYFLRRRNVKSHIWEQLKILKNMRDRLAHLRPVAYQELFSQEFLNLDRSRNYESVHSFQ